MSIVDVSFGGKVRKNVLTIWLNGPGYVIPSVSVAWVLNIYAKQNINFLFKWWWKLETGDGLWQQIVGAKYFKHQTIATIQPCSFDSPCWKAIMKVKQVYLAGRKIIVSNGGLVRVWFDPWASDIPFEDPFLYLFDVCQKQNYTLSDFVSAGFEPPFRRRLFGELITQWQEIM